MMVKEMMEDEDIHLRLNELAIESDPEFKKERGDRSLADEDRDGGFKHEIEVKNAEDLQEDEINGGFKHEIDQVKNAEDLQEDEIEEHKDIVRRLNKDINSDIKAEQREEFAEEEWWDHAEDLDIDPTDSEWNSSDDDDGESEETKKKLEEMDASDSGLGTLEVLEEMVEEYPEFIDKAIEMFKDGEEKKKREVLMQMNRSLNKGYKRVNNEVQWLEKNNEIETLESYFKNRPYINKIFYIIEEVIETIYRCIDEDCSPCADELNQWKADLGEWILRIREMKPNNKNNAQADGGIEA